MNPDALAIARGGMFLPHEAAPVGVPSSYDWAARPKLTLARSDMPALTGWLQAFKIGATVTLQMTGLQSWARVGSDWQRLQGGDVEGGTFRPDFSSNDSRPPVRFSQADGVATVEWSDGAWHCWPNRRALVPGGAVEIAVVCQVRTIVGTLLVGCGADYWRSLSEPYGDGTNNPGIGVGRLRVISDAWAWVGFSSAP